MKLHIFTAKVRSISPEHQRNATRYKYLIVDKPAPTNDFDEKIGKDDAFRIVVFNDKIDRIPENVTGKIVEIGCYLQGKEVLIEGKEISYFNEMILYGIKLAEVKKEF